MSKHNSNRGFLGPNAEVLTDQEQAVGGIGSLVVYTLTLAKDRDRLRERIDLNAFNLRIWAVNASGFLTDSYNL